MTEDLSLDVDGSGSLATAANVGSSEAGQVLDVVLGNSGEQQWLQFLGMQASKLREMTATAQLPDLSKNASRSPAAKTLPVLSKSTSKFTATGKLP